MDFKSKLEEYKYENNYSTSEDAFRLDKQPINTCPMIDKIISGVNCALAEIEELEKKEGYDLYWVKRNLEDLEKHAEDARENSEKIRSWGQGWKDISKKFFELASDKIDDVL